MFILIKKVLMSSNSENNIIRNITGNFFKISSEHFMKN